MIEVMIPDIFWNNDPWCIRRIKSIDELNKTIQCADGRVQNIIVIVESDKNLKGGLRDVFKKYAWLEKVLVKKQDTLLGIYRRN